MWVTKPIASPVFQIFINWVLVFKITYIRNFTDINSFLSFTANQNSFESLYFHNVFFFFLMYLLPPIHGHTSCLYNSCPGCYQSSQLFLFSLLVLLGLFSSGMFMSSLSSEVLWVSPLCRTVGRHSIAKH